MSPKKHTLMGRGSATVRMRLKQLCEDEKEAVEKAYSETMIEFSNRPDMTLDEAVAFFHERKKAVLKKGSVYPIAGLQEVLLRKDSNL